MKLSDKDALLLCVQALPTADVWHEISQDRMIEIYQQSARELARLESIEFSAKKLLGMFEQYQPDGNHGSELWWKPKQYTTMAQRDEALDELTASLEKK